MRRNEIGEAVSFRLFRCYKNRRRDTIRCRAFSFSGKNEERVILLRFYVDLVKLFQGKTILKTA